MPAKNDWSDPVLVAAFRADWASNQSAEEVGKKYGLTRGATYAQAVRIDATRSGRVGSGKPRKPRACKPRPERPAPPELDFRGMIAYALAYVAAPTVEAFAAERGTTPGRVADRMDDIRRLFRAHPTGAYFDGSVMQDLKAIADMKRPRFGADPKLKVASGGNSKSVAKREENNAAARRRKAWTHDESGREMARAVRLRRQAEGKLPVMVPPSKTNLKEYTALVAPERIPGFIARNPGAYRINPA